MDLATTALSKLLPRQQPQPNPDDPGQQLLKLLQNPFYNSLQVGSIWASLGSSIGITAGIALAFSFLRPYNTVVYAPKLKHADEIHAPPPLGKGVFAWMGPLWKTSENDLVRLVGMDAALFIRFTRMCRNLFVLLAILGCSILIPLNHSKSTAIAAVTESNWLMMLTPRNVYGDALWGSVVVAWLFNIIICGILWWNYRKVLHLRRAYFQSDEYQQSLHARTLMMYDIPKKMASDEGIARIIDEVAPNSSFSRTAVARNVKILPELIAEHEKTVRKLEKVLAKYLKDPKNLPPSRPQCQPSKKDRSYETYARGQKVDAIDYLTQRIKDLEFEIKEVRLSVDKRNTMPYGFASYSEISEAHAIAFAAKKKPPQGTTITLAPRPNDIIWDNMPLTKATRSRRRWIINLWVALLTFLWIAPNAMIAIFLVNLSNLGLLWPAFKENLQANTGFWQVVQGIANPAITSLIYLILPIIFRRLSMRAGDQTKSGRERHVIAKLYGFFVFNNLVIFSLFSSLWGFITGVVNKTSKGVDAWQAILQQNLGQSFLVSLCNLSPFWVTWLLQRQLGAAIDLAQLWPLFYSFIMRKFSSPTPREMIELTAPPPFDYASYYNYFLFYATVTLCFAGIQPLVLPAAAIYFFIDVALKKYLLMYVFVTKTESGGMAWRVLYNRFVFAAIFSNLVVFMTVWVQGNSDHIQAYAVAPLPFLMIAFKIYCAKTFDTKIHYFSTRFINDGDPNAGMAVGKESMRNDRLAARFGHPVLYKPLITPMVHAKAQNILASVYQGRLSDGREAGSGDSVSVSGYSDTYRLDNMHAGKPGKSIMSMPGFEVVPESKLDFEFYKNRDEFAGDHGGGDIFGTRPETPSIPGSSGPDSRPGTPVGGMTGRRQFSAAQSMRAEPGPAGYGISRSGSPGPIGPSGYGPTRTDSPGPISYGHPRMGSPAPGPSGYGPPRTGSPGPGPGGYGPMRTGSPTAAISHYPEQPSHYTVPSSGTYSTPLAPGGDSGMSRTRSPLYGMGAGANESDSNLVANAAGMPETPGTGSTTAPGSRYGHTAPGMLGGGPYGYGGLPQTETELEQDPMTYDYFRGGSSARRHNTGGGYRR